MSALFFSIATVDAGIGSALTLQKVGMNELGVFFGQAIKRSCIFNNKTGYVTINHLGQAYTNFKGQLS